MPEIKCPFCSTPVRVVAGKLADHTQAGGRPCVGAGSPAAEARDLHARTRRRPPGDGPLEGRPAVIASPTSPLPLPRRHHYQEAKRIAEALAGELAAACLRIEIAGSVRRGASSCGDVELVAIPRTERRPRPRAQVGLFDVPEDWPEEEINCVWERIAAIGEGGARVLPVKPSIDEMEPDPNWEKKRIAGSRYFRLFLPRAACKVDLFLVDPATWGPIFTIRTGSGDFSKALVQRWTDVSGGGHVEGGRLRKPSGEPIDTPEEADVFAAVQARYIEPAQRRGALDLRRL